MTSEQLMKQWGHIVAKAWQDDAFKKRLLVNPSVVLNEQGLEVATGVQIRVVENTDKVLHLTLPAKPRGGELSEAELAGVAGGRLSHRLVADLAAVFGWSADQIGQILDAGRGKSVSGGSGGGDSPGDDGRE